MLQLAELAEAREDFLLGFLADAACVQEDEIRLFLIVDARPSAQLQVAGQALAVQIVHLATPRLDEIGLAHFEDGSSFFTASRASANSCRASSS